MFNRLQKYLPVLLGITILVALVALLSRAWFELASGVLDNDALLFQTVGRGYLNGYLPYVDLFETKPPGIFLIHALSWWLFESQMLVKFLQVVVLLGIPVLTLIPVLKIIEDRPAVQRKVLSLLSILFGLLLALYTAQNAGKGLVESYGAFTALWFLVILVTRDATLVTRFCLGVLLLVSVGLKEPFLLIILAGVILLFSTFPAYAKATAGRQHFNISFILPLAVAVVLGFAALLLTGIAAPFFQIYLPHMLTFHIHQTDLPVYVRMFEFWRIFINLGSYSWWFAVGVTLVCFSVLFKSLVTSHWSLVIRITSACLLTFLAIAMGGDFYSHHFVFAVPVYAVVWWMYIRGMGEGVWEKRILSVVGIMLVGTALCNTQFSYTSEKASWKAREAELKHVASVMDTVMERCGYEQYLQMVVRNGGPYAYTKASPYGPIFVHYARFLARSQSYADAHIAALKETPLILLLDIENSNLTDFAQQYLGTMFTEEPPACAGEDYDGVLPYHLLFRED